MKLVKDGISVELTNEIQIRAYLNSGYTQVSEPEKDPKPKKKGAKGDGTA